MAKLYALLKTLNTLFCFGSLPCFSNSKTALLAIHDIQLSVLYTDFSFVRVLFYWVCHWVEVWLGTDVNKFREIKDTDGSHLSIIEVIKKRWWFPTTSDIPFQNILYQFHSNLWNLKINVLVCQIASQQILWFTMLTHCFQIEHENPPPCQSVFKVKHIRWECVGMRHLC